MKDYTNIINRIKNGEEIAYNELLNNHYKIIYKVIYDQNLNTGDYMVDVDSLYQEGCLALYDAVFSYQNDKGMAFSSYAYMVIRSKIKAYIKKSRRIYEQEGYSIDAHEGIDYCSFVINNKVSENPVLYHHEIETEEKLKKFISGLSIDDQQLLMLRKKKYSYKDIADRLNINTKRVDNRLRMLKRKINEYMKE